MSWNSGRKNSPVFEVNGRPIVEDKFWVLEYSFPVPDAPLKVGTAVALPHADNKRAKGKKKAWTGQVSKTVGRRVRILRGTIFAEGDVVEREDNEMTYFVAPLYKVLCLLVSPFLPWPLFGQVHRLVDELFVALFAVWGPVRVLVPRERCCGVSVKT